MFSKKPQTPAYAGMNAQASPGGASAFVAAAMKNPVLSVGGAALLFVLAGAGVLLAAGDPHAGDPIVRMPVTQPGAAPPPPGWRGGPGARHARRGAHQHHRLAWLTPSAWLQTPAPIQGQGGDQLPRRAGSAAAVDHTGQALAPAPMAGFTSPGPGGALLPAIAADGRTPAEAYARPFPIPTASRRSPW